MPAGRIELGEREAKLMQHFIEDIVRGSMSTIDDTIQRIDVPVTPASIKPDSSPTEEVPLRRWPVKTIAMSATYLAVGLAVFSYAGMPIDEAERSMKLFASDVMPELQALQPVHDRLGVPA